MAEKPLTDKQKDTLAKFRTVMGDVAQPDWDDHYYCRWLSARSWDLKKSEKMLREDAAWRKQYETNKLLEWPKPEVLVKYYPGGYFGVDKEGYPIWIDTLGSIDMKGMVYCTTKRDVIRFKLQSVEWLFQERFQELSEKYGKKIDQVVVIFDMEGIGVKHLWKPAIDLLTELLALLEAHYPETMRTCYAINAPKIFPIAYALAKPFLSEYTRTKIHVIGGNWKAHLLKYIDADQLPVHWGGTQTDPDGDEYCRSKICMGGKVPESYRMDNFMENIDMSNFVTVTIQRGSSLQLDFEVAEANSVIGWQFRSEGNDIGFGVYKRTAEERQKAADMEEVVRSERVNSHFVPENGQITCADPGTYVLRFDNTYSWVSAKKLQYLVEVHAPDEGKELNFLSTDL